MVQWWRHYDVIPESWVVFFFFFFFLLYCKGREYYCFIPLLTWLEGCRFDSKVILSISAIMMFYRNCVCCQRLWPLRSVLVLVKTDDCLVYDWPINACVAIVNSMLIGKSPTWNRIFWDGNNHFSVRHLQVIGSNYRVVCLSLKLDPSHTSFHIKILLDPIMI